MSRQEAVEYLKTKHGYEISTKTLTNKIGAGEGPDVEYIFGRPQFKPEALDRWMMANREMKRAFSR